MAVASSWTRLRLPFGVLLKYGIVALVLLVAGYVILFPSLRTCLAWKREEHVSPHGTFTVTEYPSCFYNRIEIVNNQSGKVTRDLAASNRNAEPYNRWFNYPWLTGFARWESDLQFVVVGGLLGEGFHVSSVDAKTGRIIKSTIWHPK